MPLSKCLLEKNISYVCGRIFRSCFVPNVAGERGRDIVNWFFGCIWHYREQGIIRECDHKTSRFMLIKEFDPLWNLSSGIMDGFLFLFFIIKWLQPGLVTVRAQQSWLGAALNPAQCRRR